MRVAVCETKSGPNAIDVYIALSQGIVANGDEYVPIKYQKDIDKIESCDLVMHIGEVVNSQLGFRRGVLDKCNKKEIRRLVIDTGCLRHIRGDHLNNPYYSFGFDGIKGFGSYHNGGSSSDRFDKLDIKIHEWRESSKYKVVLVGASSPTGWSSTLYNHNEWLQDTISDTQGAVKGTEKIVKTKIHPNISGGDTSFNDLSDACLVMCAASNISIDAIVLGIPVICPCEFNLIYEYCQHSLGSLIDIEGFDRSQMLNDLAYTQYSVKEMQSGLAWNNMRPYLHSKPSARIDIQEYAKSHNSQCKLSI